MQYTFATIALAAASIVSAQGVTQTLTPSSPAPAGCSTTYSGKFEITVALPNKKRSVISERASACASDGTLVASLSNGVLTDAKGRIGAIVANHQFQFDGPPAQTGSIYTGGFSVCSNGSLALGGSTIFYQCKSGDFYNLYDDNKHGALCQAVIIDVMPCGASSGGASQGGDGQPTVTSAATQKTDGQVQATSAATQKSDGQVQASSAASKVTQISDGQVQASSARPKPVSQFTDGQIQVTASPTPVGQIGDGQIQASSAGPKVTQISDGQIQASSAGPKVTQISDGQIQASSAVAGNATRPATATPSTFTGAAAPVVALGGSIMAVAVAAVALL